MLYTFLSKDILLAKEIGKKDQKLIKDIDQYKVIKFNSNNYNFDQILNEIQNQDIFNSKKLIILDEINNSNLINLEETLKILELAATETEKLIFFYSTIEGNFIEEILEKIKKISKKIEIIDAENKTGLYSEQKTNNNFKDKTVFLLTDKLGQKDKKGAWLTFNKITSKEFIEEELHGSIFWFYKSLKLASQTNEKESGLHPFVYKKSKAFLKNYDLQEIDNILFNLVDIYNQGHSGKTNIKDSLEIFILSI